MPSSELHVEIVARGPDPQQVREAVEEALGHDRVRSELAGAEHRIITSRPSDDGDSVRAIVYDYDNDRSLVLDVPLGDGGEPAVASTGRAPLPAQAEREAALAVLREDPELGPALRDGRLEPYRPMPPLLADELPDGRLERAVTVGLDDPAGNGERHEIVAVRLGRREVVRFPDRAPPGALARERLCGPPGSDQLTVSGVAGSAQVTVTDGSGDVVWRLIANRPAASSGTSGSGVELRNVSYRGKRVFRRAHVPILNVRYDGDRCGPFRDWQYEESMFDAQGTDVAPGFRLCPSPARTMLESGHDHGKFHGVAVYVEGEEVVLVSELEAGWYRYLTAWRLHADGTIRPRFGFAAVRDSCVCNRHHHHAYWRLDFDVAGGGDCAVREFNDPPVTGSSPWHTLRHETRRRRDPARGRRWQVVNRATGESATLEPGPDDGERDAYGVGDLWALRRRPGEVDDSVGLTADPDDTRAHIDRFVDDASILGTDVVLWYAGHFAHDVGHEHVGGETGHIVGPTLTLGGWDGG
jgi:hypothetical protein